MAVADVSQSLALQQEYVRPELEDLSLSASVLWKRIEENTKIKAVSNRPSRVPTMPIRGGKGRRGSLDGGDMGIGSGPQSGAENARECPIMTGRFDERIG